MEKIYNTALLDRHDNYSPNSLATVNLSSLIEPNEDDLRFVEESPQFQADLAAQVSPAALKIAHLLADPLVEPTGEYRYDIGQIPLLNKDEEIELARTLRRGKIAKEMMASDDFMKEERKTLKQVTAEGEAARRRMILANLRLVVRCARNYNNRGMEFEDLIQEGNLGLMKGIDRYDPEKGFKLSTYIYWWIRQSVTRGLADKSNLIRLPVHIQELMAKYTKTTQEFKNESEEQLTLEQIAQRMDVKNITRVREIESYFVQKNHISMEKPMDEEDDNLTFGETVQGESTEETQPGISVERDEQSEIMEKLLSVAGLSEREEVILLARKTNAKPVSFAELGQQFGITRERARQIEGEALKKLANYLTDHPDMTQQLKEIFY